MAEEEPKIKRSPRIDLTQGPVHKHLTRMALPMIIGLTANMSFTFVDSYFIAQLGTDEVAAMGYITRVAMVIISLTIGLMAGVSSVVARVAGRGDQEEIKNLSTNTLYITFALSIFVTIAGLATIDPLFRAMGANEQVMPLIREYMMIWYFSPLFIMLPMTGGAVMRALGDTKLQGNLMVISAILNAILDPLLIFGYLGFPELGLEGAAWASFVTRFVSFAIIFWSLYYQYHVISFGSQSIQNFMNSIKKILHVGIPATGTNLIIPIVAVLIITVVSRFGTEAVAATHVATTVEMISLVLFFSASAVIGPFIGQNLGAGKFDRIDEAITKITLFCLAWGAFVALILGLFAPSIASIFRKEEVIVSLATSYLYVVPVSYGLYGLVMSVNAIFNSLGKPMPGVAISCLRVFFLQLPLFYYAALYFDLETGFITISISNAIAGIVAYFWVRSAINKLRMAEESAA